MFVKCRMPIAVSVVAGSVALLALAAPALAEPAMFGVRAGLNTDVSGAFVGGEALTEVSPSWWFNPNLEFATGNDTNLWALSADFHHDFAVARPTLFWMGLGPAMLIRDYQHSDRSSDTNVAADLLAGVGWRTRGGAIPYFQAKAVLSSSSYGSFGFGIRF
jgi:hypothetical protein